MQGIACLITCTIHASFIPTPLGIGPLGPASMHAQQGSDSTSEAEAPRQERVQQQRQGGSIRKLPPVVLKGLMQGHQSWCGSTARAS
jgi:hypothetical protein